MIALTKPRIFLSLGLAAVGAVAVQAQPVIGVGHTDIGIGYEAGAWDLHIHKELPEPEEEFEPGDAVLQVKLLARTPIPENPAFGFLGTAGDTVWVLPKDADPNQLLFLGIGAEELDPADWTGPLTLHLKAVQGPGEFFIWDVDTLGQPVVLMNSRDGVSAVDQLTVQAGSHGHYNYGFTTPGTYRVTVAASGTRKETGFSTSDEATYTFWVEGPPPAVIGSGHTDIGIGYEDGAWDLHIHKELPEPEEEFTPGDAVLQVKLLARTPIPENAAFGFLGTAGDTVWVLPKDADPNQLLFLGIGSEELDPADWTGPLTLHLKAVQGPGEFFIWDVDTLGQPVVLMNSRDGVSAVDQLTVQAGSHGHYNYAFTTPGTYRVTVAASGTRKETGFSSSREATYTFQVEPAVLTTEHVDIKVVYQPNSSTNLLAVYVSDDDHGVRYRGDEAVMVVGEPAKTVLPAGTPLGPEGATLWILPASQNVELLYLGMSAEGLAQGIFSGNLDFRLKAVQGPGHFILYQADLGGLNLRMDSRDGIDDRDRTDLIVGSHEHLNWSFTTNGVYRVTFQAGGQRVGESTNIFGAETTLVFHVLPLPPELPDLDPMPAQLAVRRMANGDFELDLTGTPGARYAVEISSDLNQWSPFQTVQLTGGTASLALPNNATARFFRATAR